MPVNNIFGAPPGEVIRASDAIVERIRPLLTDTAPEAEAFAFCYLVAEYICQFPLADRRVVFKHAAEIIEMQVMLIERTGT
jgi:hypothetical protein